jgi:hypothetical protein
MKESEPLLLSASVGPVASASIASKSRYCVGRITLFAFSGTGEVMLDTDAMKQIADSRRDHRLVLQLASNQTEVTANILTIFHPFHF